MYTPVLLFESLLVIYVILVYTSVLFFESKILVYVKLLLVKKRPYLSKTVDYSLLVGIYEFTLVVKLLGSLELDLNYLV